MNEIFVPVKAKGFEDRYLISNLGRIYSIKTGIYLKPYMNYHTQLITLCKDGLMKNFSLGRLVLKAFERHPNIKEIAAHLDLNGENNQIDNLKWMSRGQWLRYCRTNEGKIKGVYKFQHKKDAKVRWRSTLQINGKVKTFGYFDDKQDAIDMTYKTFMSIFGYAPW